MGSRNRGNFPSWIPEDGSALLNPLQCQCSQARGRQVPGQEPDAECCFGSPSTRVRAKPDCVECQGKGLKSIFLMNPSKPSWRGKGQSLLLLSREFLCGGSRENQQQWGTCFPVTASLNYQKTAWEAKQLAFHGRAQYAPVCYLGTDFSHLAGKWREVTLKAAVSYPSWEQRGWVTPGQCLVTVRTKLVKKCESFFGGRDVSWETEKGHGHLFHLQQSNKAFNGNNHPGTKATD